MEAEQAKKVEESNSQDIGDDPMNSVAAKRKQADMSEISDTHYAFLEDFQPDNLLNFDLEPQGEDTYYVHCDKVGKEMKGIFMVNAASPKIDPVISVFIQDPSGKVIYAKKKRSLGQFQFTTTEKGEYKFMFVNTKSKDEKNVMFSIHNQEEKDA